MPNSPADQPLCLQLMPQDGVPSPLPTSMWPTPPCRPPHTTRAHTFLLPPQLMSKNRVPSALVTTMDRHTTDALLERLGLRHYFTCTVTGAWGGEASLLHALQGSSTCGVVEQRVCMQPQAQHAPAAQRRSCLFSSPTADDDMETIAQRFLSAAIKLGRPPDHCVVFAACPTAVTGELGEVECQLEWNWKPVGSAGGCMRGGGSRCGFRWSASRVTCAHLPLAAPPPAAAHNCTMKAVAVMGAWPCWLSGAEAAGSAGTERPGTQCCRGILVCTTAPPGLQSVQRFRSTSSTQARLPPLAAQARTPLSA